MSQAFHRSIYDQFDRSLEYGVETFGVSIPVVSLGSNRITVGANAKALPRAPHTVSIRKHPSQAIRVTLESTYGLACPDPLSGEGIRVTELPPDVAEASPAISRHAGFLIVSKPDDSHLYGASFEGDYCHLNGVNRRDQNLFIAQVAGAALREATQVVPLP